MSTTNAGVDGIIDSTEKLGVVGSPSSTAELALDILGAAVNKKLVGELALFRFLQDSIPHYALGQITEIQLKNIWHEDPTMRSLIRQRGRVDAVSERQDTHLGQMILSAVFRKAGTAGYEPSMLGTVPSTGTPIHIVTDAVLDEILRPYREQIFYLGHVYGSRPKLPMWFKHFGRGPDGAGEAYHLGIFGKTGSGKSVLAKMLLLAYARSPKMALLVVDPQGEFSKDVRGVQSGEFQLPLGQLFTSLGKEHYVLTVRNLILDRWELFAQILYESNFFQRLTMPRGTNRQNACELLQDKLPGRKISVNGHEKTLTLGDLHTRAAFDAAWALLLDEKNQAIVYPSKEARGRLAGAIAEANRDSFYNDYWQPVTELFKTDRQNASTVERAIHWMLGDSSHKRILIVDLSKEQASGLFWNDDIQSLVIKRLLQGVTDIAEAAFRNSQGTSKYARCDR